MPFDIVWTDQIKKDFKRFDKHLAKRIYEKVRWANQNDVLRLEKVEASDDYKYRVGSYRVFFEKLPGNVLFALTVLHRSIAYKRTKK
ncbi:MAG: type II toxin-antitoxin system RelE/ParE family toxin [Candidatus Diapherotrites archaeon]|nr:type II toxin-antitoxin system RelE/ParE family toxin [Candidatus Diapherotrites archaeon]